MVDVAAFVVVVGCCVVVAGASVEATAELSTFWGIAMELEECTADVEDGVAEEEVDGATDEEVAAAELLARVLQRLELARLRTGATTTGSGSATGAGLRCASARWFTPRAM